MSKTTNSADAESIQQPQPEPEIVEVNVDPELSQQLADSADEMQYRIASAARTRLGLSAVAMERLMDHLEVCQTDQGALASVKGLEGLRTQVEVGGKKTLVMPLDSAGEPYLSDLEAIADALKEQLGSAAFDLPRSQVDHTPTSAGPADDGVTFVSEKNQLVAGEEGDLFTKRQHKPVLIRRSDSQDLATYMEAKAIAEARGVELKVVPDPLPEGDVPASGDIILRSNSIQEYRQAREAHSRSGRGVFTADGERLFPRTREV